MKKFRKVNPKWYRHEALHTCHVALSLISDQLVEHTYYDSEINPEYNKKIDEAIDALFKAYQLAGLDRTNEVKKYIRVSK